ncbi:MAG: hypothetical protein C0425_07730 [Chlorobiaceae bacterium]|nr:hypothetical protein [Chlorobiaceae bacterium]MBA4310211.1 hypothetical protein [Chlorobiaceae bacterium]
MIINLLQYAPAWENKEINSKKILSLLEKKSSLGDVLILPELTLTGFSMNVTSIGETLNEKSVDFFSYLATKYKTNVLGGMVLKEGNKYFNALLHINKNGELKEVYKKIHPFTLAEEDKYYTAGERFIIAEIENVRFGLSICYDLRFPELYRFYAKQNVQVMVNIANWPVKRAEHWRVLLKARAIENQFFMIGVNRVGDDNLNLHYDGSSSVYDPKGEKMIELLETEALLTVEIDPEVVRVTREVLPFLKDMKLI